MNFDTLATWGTAVMLITVRFSVALGMSPVLASYGLPAMVRVALIVALSALVCAGGNITADPRLLDDGGALMVAVAAEAVSGALLGLGVHVVMAAFAVAGRLLDVQIGFGIGSVFDPVTRSSANVLTSLLSLLGVTLFVMADAHIALASMLAASFSVFPLGEFPQLADPLRMLSAVGALFSFGLALAAPAVLALLVTDVAMGLISRNSPQINVLLLSIPVKVLIGLLVLTVSIPAWAPLVERLFSLSSDVLGARP
ncbi:flagellar biosynthetic protein FliR [Aquabacterium sp. A7-Y]|uniref:flagellar biosynthetic protein FliR n=1 Tax=Aquabacterium sp. A7-Y TaxID=1349605 RepID=UPI00223CEBF2|nr:flagellar biosynthetic protein FliR [Aquabacterium sp. A7-Y]MCW7540886.1 flagellar biosynthetic protein FliR [Aquabacterium sp. A7-Y]